MAERKSPQKKKKFVVDRFASIEAALRKLKKDELIALLIEAARQDEDACHDLESHLQIDKPVDLLLDDIKSAIARATNFDRRDFGKNFDVDWAAYKIVQSGFKELLSQDQLSEAQELALELMKKGSYQVQCSDEGDMCDEIEGCLKPVIGHVKKLMNADAAKWAAQMLAADRSSCICERELNRLLRAAK